jgi:NAD/NADP transhydrogenase alpha subunit
MPSATPDEVRTAAFVDPTLLPGAGVGVAGLLAIAMASVGMSVLRRRHGRRLLAARVAARLAAFAGVPADVGEADGTPTRLRSVD